jgi:hypothetical protein
MSNRLIILQNKLNLHVEAAMATLMEIKQEATKLQSTADVSTSALSNGLTDEQTTKLLTRRERTIRKRTYKS